MRWVPAGTLHSFWCYPPNRLPSALSVCLQVGTTYLAIRKSFKNRNLNSLKFWTLFSEQLTDKLRIRDPECILLTTLTDHLLHQLWSPRFGCRASFARDVIWPYGRILVSGLVCGYGRLRTSWLKIVWNSVTSPLIGHQQLSLPN